MPQVGQRRRSASSCPVVTRLRRGWKLRMRRSKWEPAGSAAGPVPSANIRVRSGLAAEVRALRGGSGSRGVSGVAVAGVWGAFWLLTGVGTAFRRTGTGASARRG